MQLIFFPYLLIINLSMSKVKTFFSIFRDSLLPQHPFYSKLLKTNSSISFKYFIAVILAFYFLYIISMAVILPKRLKHFQPVNIRKSLESFPDDLVVTVNHGQMMTNYSRPYFIWSHNDEKMLLLVIDETGNPEKISEYGAAALLTSRNITVRNPISGEYRNYSLKNMNAKFDKEAVMKYIKRFEIMSASALIIGILVCLLVLPVLFFVAVFIFSFIAALFTYIIWNLTKSYHQKTNVTFSKIAQISMHTITFPLLLVFILNLFNIYILFKAPYFLIVLIALNTGVYEAYWKEKHHASYRAKR